MWGGRVCVPSLSNLYVLTADLGNKLVNVAQRQLVGGKASDQGELSSEVGLVSGPCLFTAAWQALSGNGFSQVFCRLLPTSWPWESC